ncbi:hypoxia inducible factor 1 subunit alpha, like 2 [Brachyhypopomus gauderio]|uniref:hypoxia inducible factor 1 subunit alpha, like 2 n=1 Tax=Brachyhypopomus gauderio TaxID=698409 RepID=UPI0040433C52
MITVRLETVLRDSFDQELQVKQRCKQKASMKTGRMCSEWRRVRSRMAARSRREKEKQLLREIATLLPVASLTQAQLDKASIIRLTIAHLHLRALLDYPGFSTVPATPQALSSSQGKVAEQSEKWFLDCALGGFLLILSLNGKIIFATNDVVSHTGINQMDLIGRSLFDFLHPCDQSEVKAILMKLIGSQGEKKCEVLIRIKATGNHKLTPWKVIHCTGVTKSSSVPGFNCLILLCRTLPVHEIIEMEAHLNSRTFLSIHGPDMKFNYCNSGVLKLTGFSDTELYGQSVYQYYHPADCQHVLKAHLSLFSKGQVYTGKYRLLQKGGGYVWAETDATVIYNIRTGKPESIICVNYILSGVELADVVFSLEQTDRLLKTCDPVKPVGQSITDPFIRRAVQNGTHQATSATAEKQPSVPSSHAEGAANGRIEIMLQTAVSDSLTCDICELDLDSLAPYIPMDDEDFLLTPALDAAVVPSEVNTHWPSLTRPWLKLDAEQHSPLEKVFPATTDILSTLQHTYNYFPLTNWASKTPELIPSRQWHEFLNKVNRKQQVQTNCGSSSIQIKTNQHKTDIVNSCCHYLPNSVFCGPKYSRLSWGPPGPLVQHTAKTTEENMCSASVGLPTLSSWECEVNAPLGPTSSLLQGTELTTVLDQVASRMSWY